MIRQIPPRLRAPLVIVVLGLAVGAVNVGVLGWATVPVVLLVCVVLFAAIGYYVWGGRDSDMAAYVRREPDERQEYRRLKVQALVGRVMTMAAAIALLVAVDAKATLWPFLAALVLPLLTAVAGWAIYGDRHAPVERG